MVKRGQQAKHRDDDSESEAESGLAGDIPNIKREFILTPSTDDALHDAVRIFSRATGTNLTKSHFLRVLLKCVAHAMPELESELSDIKDKDLKRPSNAKESQAAREEYERKLAAAVVSALRKAPLYDAATAGRGKGRGTGKRSA